MINKPLCSQAYLSSVEKLRSLTIKKFSYNLDYVHLFLTSMFNNDFLDSKFDCYQIVKASSSE